MTGGRTRPIPGTEVPATDGGAGRVDGTVLERLLADLGPDAAAEVCALFVTDARARAGIVAVAFATDDADGVARAAHRLKSASGFVGANTLATLCGDIERLARAERLTDARAGVEAIAGEVDGACAALDAHLARLIA